MIDTTYICTVLGRFEGKGITRGYVPSRNGEPIGASGVTIATGLDLGQQTRASLEAMGIPSALINRFSPYLGAQKKEAQYILAKYPLTLTREEVETVDAAVHTKYIDETAELFGRDAFAAAPKEVQAVATSLHYQFGTPYRKASPALGNAWASMQRGDYARAAAQLRDPAGWSKPHQQYLKRRQAEAGLLAALTGGKDASGAKLPSPAGVAQSSHTLASADGHEDGAA